MRLVAALLATEVPRTVARILWTVFVVLILRPQPLLVRVDPWSLGPLLVRELSFF